MSMYKTPGETGTFTEETKFETSPVQQHKAAARSEHVDNLERVMQDAIAAVKVSTPERDASQNARFRYERNYERLRQAVRGYVLASGKQVSVPAYLPPPTRTEQFSSFGPGDFPVDLGFYNETKDRRNLPAGSAAPNFADPESDAHQAWLSTQGAPPVDTTGKSPDEVSTVRRARAGVQ